MSNYRGHGRQLPYDEPKYNDVSYVTVPPKYKQPQSFEEVIHYDNYEDYHHEEQSYDYEPTHYDEDLHFEEPLHYEEDPYYEESPPYESPLFQYDTYEPNYHNHYGQPQYPQEPPRPFDISFDDWLDTSGVDAFGIPSTTVRSYASPPQYNNHIGQRQRTHYSPSYNQAGGWLPSEGRVPPYRPNKLIHHNTQVELPYLATKPSQNPEGHSALQALNLVYSTTPRLYTPPPAVKYVHELPRPKYQERYKKQVPGSIWTGLASFANSLEEKNHYRRHPAGMVSMGSEELDYVTSNQMDMSYSASHSQAVFVKPPTDFVNSDTTTENVINTKLDNSNTKRKDDDNKTMNHNDKNKTVDNNDDTKTANQNDSDNTVTQSDKFKTVNHNHNNKTENYYHDNKTVKPNDKSNTVNHNDNNKTLNHNDNNKTVNHNVPFYTELQSNISHPFSNKSDTNHYRLKEGVYNSVSNDSTTENSRPPVNDLTFLDHLLVDSTLMDTTIKRMSVMLKTYFSDWRG